jgi:hypothetical protein
MTGKKKIGVQYNVHEGSRLPKTHVRKICMNGAHETIRNNRPGSFIKVFIHERYCKLCEGTQIISGKKLNFKIPAFILVK